MHSQRTTFRLHLVPQVPHKAASELKGQLLLLQRLLTLQLSFKEVKKMGRGRLLPALSIGDRQTARLQPPVLLAGVGQLELEALPQWTALTAHVGEALTFHGRTAQEQTFIL